MWESTKPSGLRFCIRTTTLGCPTSARLWQMWESTKPSRLRFCIRARPSGAPHLPGFGRCGKAQNHPDSGSASGPGFSRAAKACEESGFSPCGMFSHNFRIAGLPPPQLAKHEPVLQRRDGRSHGLQPEEMPSAKETGLQARPLTPETSWLRQSPAAQSKNCQAPRLQTKVTTTDRMPLTSHLSRRYLAG